MSFCVVVFPAEPEVGGYVGACVEKYLVTQGRTIEDVHYSMESILATHVLLDLEAGVPPLSGVPPAPLVYRRAFMAAEVDLGFGPLRFRDCCANDTGRSREAEALTAGPRHYRYTDRRPPSPQVWF